MRCGGMLLGDVAAAFFVAVVVVGVVVPAGSVFVGDERLEDFHELEAGSYIGVVWKPVGRKTTFIRPAIRTRRVSEFRRFYLKIEISPLKNLSSNFPTMYHFHQIIY